MPRHFSLVALLSLLVFTAAASSRAFAREGTTILHNGSVQGVLGAASGGVATKSLAYILQERSRTPELVLVSCGNMWGPSVTSHVDGGALSVDIMNRAGYDAMAVGPHEFFAGLDNFGQRLAEARFPVLCTNMAFTDTPLIAADSIKPFVKVSRDGTTTLVFGFIDPSSVERWPQWPACIRMTDPVEALEHYRGEAEDADVVIVLGTMSFERGITLLDALPWVDVVIAHPAAGSTIPTASTFMNRTLDGRILIWSACHGSHLARITRSADTSGTALRCNPVELTSNMPQDPRALADVEQLETRARSEAGTPLSTLSDAERAAYARTLLNALRYELTAEVAFIHAGALRHKTPPASITRQILGTTFPFPDRVALVDVTGERLERIWKKRDEKLINGAGLEIVGMTTRNSRILVNGRPLDRAETYRVATTEFLALGGLELLPASPASILDRRLVDVFATHFEKLSLDDRTRRLRNLRNRPVRRAATTLDASFSRLDFDGAASLYQYSDPNATYTASDIPGFVGTQNRQWSFALHHRNVVDWPTADLTFDLEMKYSTWNDYKMVDRASFDVIYEDQSPSDRPHVFAGFNLTGTVRTPDVPGANHPLFAKTLFGLVWNLTPHAKVLAGAAHLLRLSQPDDPDNLGFNLRYEVSRSPRSGVDFTSNVDYFTSFDSDDIQTLDFSAELRLKLIGHLSTVARYTTFLWHDDVIDDTASRRELYFGLGYTLPFRRF